MAVLTMWSLVAETKEWCGPITVTANGTPVGNFQVAVCEGTTRPTVWTTPDADPDPPGTALGVLVGVGTIYPLTVGRKYTIFIRFTDNPEAPVERAGQIKAT